MKTSLNVTFRIIALAVLLPQSHCGWAVTDISSDGTVEITGTRTLSLTAAGHVDDDQTNDQHAGVSSPPPTVDRIDAGVASGSGGVHSQRPQKTLDEALKTIQDLNSRVQALDQALKTIQDLNTRVQALESELHRAKAAPTAASGPGSPTRLSEQVITVGVAAGGTASPDADNSRIEIYGQGMLDAFYDGKRMDPEWNQVLRPSKIPVDCQESSGCGRNGAWRFSARQSSLGVRASIPTPRGPVKTDISFDLFGVDGSTSIHWTKFWAELGKFGVGQTESNFMDIDVYPNVNDYWGPSGMVFLRSPQVRFTPWTENGTSLSFSLEAPNSVLDTGKISETSPDFGAGFSPWNRLPDLTASVRYDGNRGHVKAAGILRQVGYQNTSTLQDNPSGVNTGYGLNLTGTLYVLGSDQISAGFVVGKGIASYLNDGGFDLAPGKDLQAVAVQSIGWLAYYNHVWAENWSSAIGFSQHLQDNTAGQADTAFKRGSYGTVNLQYTPTDNVLIGLEFGFGELTQKGGQSATDLRLQSSAKVTF